MSIMAQEMRAIAKSMFDEKGITALVGFAAGCGAAWGRPAVIRSAAEAERLVWDATCGNNLAVYLPGLIQSEARAKGAQRAGAGAGSVGAPRAGEQAAATAPARRVGFIVKGCDMRAVTALIKERQAAREELVLIGMPCRGMLDRKKVEAALSAAAQAPALAAAPLITAITDGEAEITVTTADGAARTLAREPLIRDACAGCMFPAPENTDAAVSGPARAPAGADEADRRVREFAALQAAERWARFQQEMSRCIRCYACRQACPMCYCRECFAETNNPAWIGATADTEDVSIFHLGRILHQAGRCVECGACADACPMGIDLGTFTRKIAADARELFGFTADFSPDSIPPLCGFAEGDPQEFITEPDR